jgi:hypothetical protein
LPVTPQQHDSGDTLRWRREIDESLHRNIRGSCRHRTVDGRGSLLHLSASNDTNEFLVMRLLPSKHEVDKFRQLPPSLTKSDANIEVLARKEGYNADWLQMKVPRWEIPANHIGQNHSFCLRMVSLAATGKEIAFYESFREIHRAFYVAQIRHALVHPSGSVWAGCGYFMGQENCETRWDYSKQWHAQCLRNLQTMGRNWTDFFWADDTTTTAAATNNNNNHKVSDKVNDKDNANKIKKMQALEMVGNCTDPTDLGVQSFTQQPVISFHDKVFVIAALWDYNYHHLLADSLAKLARHLSYLKAHPHIKIHVRHFEDYDNAHKTNEDFRRKADQMRSNFFTLLGLDPSRFVTGMVVAKEVFLPRNMRCAWALSNPIEVRSLARVLVTAAQAMLRSPKRRSVYSPLDLQRVDAMDQDDRKTLVILQRTSGDSNRAWSNESVTEVVHAFEKYFPRHNVVLFTSSRTHDGHYCLACDIALYAHADVLVGEHGAGLTNLMFMPKGALVVELVGAFRDVSMPVCGYYGPYGAIFGHHHYLHVYDHAVETVSLRISTAAASVADFYEKIHGQDVTRVTTTPVVP